MSTRWWLHSPCYWNVWVSSFSFWFILSCLCIYHYCAPSVVFFSPLDAHFTLLTMCVHSRATCTSHSDSLVGYCTWLGFIIFPTHHSYYTFIISRFLVDDCFFILGFLCYRWLSFYSLGSYLHKVFFSLFFVDCLLLFFFFGLCLLMLSFALYFWWMGSSPWFSYTWLFLRRHFKPNVFFFNFVMLLKCWSFKRIFSQIW